MTTHPLPVGTEVRCETRIGPPFPAVLGEIVAPVAPRGELLGYAVRFGDGPTLTAYLDEIQAVTP